VDPKQRRRDALDTLLAYCGVGDVADAVTD
jgi:hypothetical protein